MARSLWTGSISFGLVNVPVKAFTAVRDHTVHFHQLEKGTGARIRNEQVSDKTGEPVDRDDIELGYEVAPGRYVTFERSELGDLRPESTRAIEVTDFVALADVDPIYYERTYWLAPAGDTAADAYQLLRTAMEERDRAAVGTVVMRNKQYLAAIRPLDGVLAMSTMRFADEVVPRADIDELPSRRTEPDAKTVKLALQIVDSLAAEWGPEQYHDTYTDQLHEIIERKDAGKEQVVEAAPEQTAQVLDLMAALQASVDAAKAGRKGPRTARVAGDTLADGNASAPHGTATNATARKATKATAKKTGRGQGNASKTAKKKAPAKGRKARAGSATRRSA